LGRNHLLAETRDGGLCICSEPRAEDVNAVLVTSPY
jgi:hypothetical protein